MNIVFLEGATKDLEDSLDYYASIHAELVSRFINDVELVLELVRSNPRVGRPLPDDLRGLPLTSFPFDLVYLIDDLEIVIVAVAHQRRRPKYWLDR